MARSLRRVIQDESVIDAEVPWMGALNTDGAWIRLGCEVASYLISVWSESGQGFTCLDLRSGTCNEEDL